MFSVDWQTEVMTIGDHSVKPKMSASGWGLLDLLCGAPDNTATLVDIRQWLWPPKPSDTEQALVDATVVEVNGVLELLTPDVRVEANEDGQYSLRVFEPTRYIGKLVEYIGVKQATLEGEIEALKAIEALETIALDILDEEPRGFAQIGCKQLVELLGALRTELLAKEPEKARLSVGMIRKIRDWLEPTTKDTFTMALKQGIDNLLAQLPF